MVLLYTARQASCKDVECLCYSRLLACGPNPAIVIGILVSSVEKNGGGNVDLSLCQILHGIHINFYGIVPYHNELWCMFMKELNQLFTIKVWSYQKVSII
jgi:hypothetical protein